MRKGAGNRDRDNHSAPCMPGAAVNVPVHLAANFPENLLVVRSGSPGALVERIDDDLGEQIDYVQLTDLDADPSPLIRWKQTFALDLTMSEPDRQFSRLYAFAPLLDRGPVRVRIPAVDGVRKAVKLAASLRFSVAIVPGQPDEAILPRLIELADFYLRNPAIQEPVEFFHSLFFAFVNGEKTTLWDILEKNPERFCYVEDDGSVAPPPKPVFWPERQEFRAANGDFPRRPSVAENRIDCQECRFFPNCAGFFKHPNPEYACLSIYPLLEHLEKAAFELKQDLASGGCLAQ